MITLLVFTNGRDELLKATLDSFQEKVSGPVSRVIINDDTGDSKHLAWLISNVAFTLPSVETVEFTSSDNAGFAGAIRNGWKTYLLGEQTPFIFHLEDDFIFNREVDLWEMMQILDTDSKLAQLALMRQPWNAAEIEAGSLYRLHPGSFTWRTGYCVHDMWFTTNPSLYTRSLVRSIDWPITRYSEGRFTQACRELGYHFGYMGRYDDNPWVTHIGNERVGHGY